MAETKAGTLGQRAQKFWQLIQWDGKRDASALFAAFARTELQRQLAEMRPWVRHAVNCAGSARRSMNKNYGPCDCGLDAKLRELGEAEQTEVK